MIYNVYWVSHIYPFDIDSTEVDTASDDACGYGEFEYVGRSLIKAEMIQLGKSIEYTKFENNESHIDIFNSEYIEHLQELKNNLMYEYPEELI